MPCKARTERGLPQFVIFAVGEVLVNKKFGYFSMFNLKKYLSDLSEKRGNGTISLRRGGGVGAKYFQ